MISIPKLLDLQGELFVLIGLGFFFRKRNLLPHDFQKGLADLVIHLILPCNILHSFFTDQGKLILSRGREIWIVALLTQIACYIFARTALSRISEERRSVMQYGTICSNAGFIGTPIVQGLYGAEGLLLSAVYLIPPRVIMWSLGLSFFLNQKQKKREKNWKKAILHPCMIAVFLGMIAMMRNIHLYPFMEKSIVALASCNTGISMFLIGMILSELKWRDFADPMILLYTFIRLITIPTVVFVACRLFGVSELVTRISVILAAMPAGGTTVILSEKYKNNVAFASGCVTVSTVMSLPSLLIWGIILK